jgi:hypothetical protein
MESRITDLAENLRRAYAAAPQGDKVVTIHLFGIRHAERLKGANLQDLAERAGIGASFGTELRKGVRLAEFVQIL